MKYLTHLSPLKILQQALPMEEKLVRQILQQREAVQKALLGECTRLVVIVGPCSIHEPNAAKEYAARLASLQQQYHRGLILVMRTYFEKPRSALGWPGFLLDPYLDGSFQINEGLYLSRELLLTICRYGVPTATEFLFPHLVPYLQEFMVWGAIGARSSENQVHRNIASGLPMPIGFKNGTDGRISIAINAMHSARASQLSIYPNPENQLVAYQTKGNTATHLVLRGGMQGPNYQPETLFDAVKQLRNAHLPTKVIVDCSHGNAGGGAEGQRYVCEQLCEALRSQTISTAHIGGIMLESFLVSGNQPIDRPGGLLYGQSITDPCLGWEETVACIENIANVLG